MINFSSHIIPKVTALTMSDLPNIYGIIDDDTLLENDDLCGVANILGEFSSVNERSAVRTAALDLIGAHPEILELRDTRYGQNFIHWLAENPRTLLIAADLFVVGPSSIRDMFYEANRFGTNPLTDLVEKLARRAAREGEENFEIYLEDSQAVDLIITKVREEGMIVSACILMKTWEDETYHISWL